MTGLHDNHNHLVANGDAVAMVRAADAAGLASFAFTEHVFHIEEVRAASRYVGTRWDGELEGPPIGIERYLSEIATAAEAAEAVDVQVGLELEHWPDDPLRARRCRTPSWPSTPASGTSCSARCTA